MSESWDPLLVNRFHELQILLIFGIGLQIMIHFIILASKARDANTIDIEGAAAEVVSIRLVSVALDAKMINCIMI